MYSWLKIDSHGSGADPGFSEGGLKMEGGSRREELALVLYL